MPFPFRSHDRDSGDNRAVPPEAEGSLNRGDQYPNPGDQYQATGYDNAGYDSAGYDNAGYDNAGYDNAGYRNPDEQYPPSGYQTPPVPAPQPPPVPRYQIGYSADRFQTPPPVRNDDTVTLAAVQARRPGASSTMVLNRSDIDDAINHRAAVPPPERPRRGISGEEFSEQLERLRSEASAEQRTAWLYLGFLGVMFGLLVLVGIIRNGNDSPDSVAALDAAVSAEPTRLVVTANGNVVDLSGVVPDTSAHDQILSLANEIYGADNVIDSLEIDPSSTLEQGTVRVVGVAEGGDERPEALQSRLTDALGLANRGLELNAQTEGAGAPVAALITLADGRVTLSGVMPDDQALASLTGLAGEIWGADKVDPTGLSVGPATWDGGVIRFGGDLAPGDERAQSFAGLVPERLGVNVPVDMSGLAELDLTVLVGEVQTRVSELVTSNPLAFAPLSADIEPASDQVLTDIASELNRVPTIGLQIVGHTDDVGPENDNQLLSEQRAAAVMTRLAELGVAPDRMTSIGKGESSPIADNSTDEGKAANRRIEFVLETAS